jgi:Trp operon repressor
MADQETRSPATQARAALIAEITRAATALQTSDPTSAKYLERTQGIKNLAEAAAWLMNPQQPH